MGDIFGGDDSTNETESGTVGSETAITGSGI
jgi:hypothetical protein